MPYYDPISDVTTPWTGGTDGPGGDAFDQVNDAVRQPTDPGTTDYIRRGFMELNEEELGLVASSANEITEITMWQNFANEPSGVFHTFKVRLKIGATYTAWQTIADQDRAWVSKTFNATSDPTLFPIASGTAINVRWFGDGAGPGTSQSVYAAYADYTENVTDNSSSSSSSSTQAESTSSQSSSSSSSSSTQAESTSSQSSSSSSTQAESTSSQSSSSSSSSSTQAESTSSQSSSSQSIETAITVTTLSEVGNNVLVKISATRGSTTWGTTRIDASALTGAIANPRLSIRNIIWAITGSGSIKLQWDGSTAKDIGSFGGSSSLNMIRDGFKFTNNADAPTGDILISETGMVVGNTASIYVELAKESGYST